MSLPESAVSVSAGELLIALRLGFRQIRPRLLSRYPQGEILQIYPSFRSRGSNARLPCTAYRSALVYACTEKTGTQTHIMTAGSWSGQQATRQMGSLLLQASRCSGVVQAARLFPATPACKSARLSLFLYGSFSSDPENREGETRKTMWPRACHLSTLHHLPSPSSLHRIWNSVERSLSDEDRSMSSCLQSSEYSSNLFVSSLCQINFILPSFLLSKSLNNL